MERDAKARGEFIGTRAFKITGLYPINADVFTDADFGPSDHALGLSSDHPAVKEPFAVTPEDAAKLLEVSLAEIKPELAAGIKRLSDEEIEKHKVDVTRLAYTSDHAISTVLAAKEKKEKDASEAAARRESKAKRVEERKAAAAAKKAAREAAREARRAAKEAAKQRAAAAAATRRSGSSSAAATAVEAEEPQSNPYARVFVGAKRRRME
jgi:flagellar biosynthesis GTPase FlhF